MTIHCKSGHLKNGINRYIAFLKPHCCSIMKICMNKALGGWMWLIMLLTCMFQLTQNFVFCSLYICLKIFQIWQFANFFIPPLLQEWIIPFLFLVFKRIYLLLQDFNLCKAWMHIYYSEYLTCVSNKIKKYCFRILQHIHMICYTSNMLSKYTNVFGRTRIFLFYCYFKLNL
jgi:hypothetical protein